MPYKSERQRRYMHAQHPEIAKRWDEKYGGRTEPKATGLQRARVRAVKAAAGSRVQATNTGQPYGQRMAALQGRRRRPKRLEVLSRRAARPT